MQKVQPASFADLSYREEEETDPQREIPRRDGCHTAVEEVARAD